MRREDIEPSVTFIVAAHDEELVIEHRIANVLALDYPADKLDILIVSDGSTDRTDGLVETLAAENSRVRLVKASRAGKTAAQDRAVRATSGEVLAFSDANTHWRPDALRKLVRNFADPQVAYVCGRHFYEQAEGTNREWVYARFEGWLRQNESRIGSITGGVGPIYAVRREDYVELDPRLGHDVVFPYLFANETDGRSSTLKLSRGRSRPATSRTSTDGSSACSSTPGSSSSGAGCSGESARCTCSSSYRTATCATRAGCST